MKQLLLITLAGLHLLASSATYGQVCNANIIKNKPNSLYTDNGNGTVTDTKTKLMWQKCSLGQTYTAGTCTGIATVVTWEAALAAANIDTQYGYSDWRVPNKNELSSLVETACSSPSINNMLFPATGSDIWWTASPVAFNNRKVWIVDFYFGNVNEAYVAREGRDDYIVYSHYVRLVRGGY